MERKTVDFIAKTRVNNVLVIITVEERSDGVYLDVWNGDTDENFSVKVTHTKGVKPLYVNCSDD